MKSAIIVIMFMTIQKVQRKGGGQRFVCNYFFSDKFLWYCVHHIASKEGMVDFFHSDFKHYKMDKVFLWHKRRIPAKKIQL